MKPIISPNIRLRYPESFSVGEYSIIDDFCYFSTKIEIGKFSHIASGCSIAGGKDRKFVLGDYCSLSSGVKIWCTSDDYVEDIVTLIPEEFGEIKNNLITGDVSIGNMCAVGSNSVIMPQNKILEGTVIGALSFVPPDFKFEPWAVYAGIPVKKIKYRNKENVMKQLNELEKNIKLKRP
jgi:acetyltransferase-like isoleucine patch superfamily enzyme